MIAQFGEVFALRVLEAEPDPCTQAYYLNTGEAEIGQALELLGQPAQLN